MSEYGDVKKEVDANHLLKDSLIKIRDLKAKLKKYESARSEPIAILGMGCRLPGGGAHPEAFWQALKRGVDGVREIPATRWPADAIPSAPPGTRWAGLLDKVDEFDARFFRIAPREALTLDPQQRLLLEVAWEALEDAGQPPDQLAGSRTGVFIGMAAKDYEQQVTSLAMRDLDIYCATGNWSSTAAGRLSYVFGLEGPCFSVDTACSSSLVTVHLACQSLRSGEIDLALTGGVSLILSPLTMSLVGQTNALSPDGRCRTFDAGANGYVRAEGCGMVVLKRLSDAQRDGDRIWALIRGSAVNQDGRSTGMTAPNMLAQQALLREALANAGVSPAQVGYVEAHGTGTPLGDPIELEALKEVLGKPRPDGSICALGSVKTNLGHLEAAAGVAGLIKVALALRHETIPRHLNFQTLNPRVSLEGTPFVIPVAEMPWRSDEAPRIAGVSSFGISGTNAHIVMEEAPRGGEPASLPGRRAVVLPLSAKSPEALSNMVEAYRLFLSEAPGEGSADIRDIAYTASVRRSHHEHRLAIVGSSREQMLDLLQAHAGGEARDGVVRGKAEVEQRPSVVFVFPGQGSQWAGMGRQLLEQEQVFRAAMEECDRAIRKETGWSVVEELCAEEGLSRLSEIDVVQPALFAMGVSLASLWRSWGVEPDAVVGHSMGEAAAAFVAGALTLEDAARIICRRSRLLKRLSGRGAMALVQLPLDEAQQALSGFEDRVSTAVSNGPRSTVLSGEPAAIEEILAKLERAQVFCRRVKVDVASHSPQMDPLLGELHAALEGLSPTATRVSMCSTVTGELCGGEELGAAYWARNLRDPVLFWRAMDRLASSDHTLFVEMSPHPILVPAIEECLSGGGRDGVALASLLRDQEEQRALLQSLAALHAHGYPVDWKRQYPAGGRSVSLPTYPWERRRFWVDAPHAGARGLELASGSRQAGQDPLASWFYELQWIEQPSRGARPERAPAPSRFLILADQSGLGAALAAELEAAGDTCVILRAGDPETSTQRILSALEACPPFHGVAYLWGLDVTPTDQLSTAALDSARQAACVPVLGLLRRWVDEKPPSRLWLVTRGAQPASNPHIALAQAPLWGLGRAIALEQPEIWGGLIDLDPAGSADEPRRLSEAIRHAGEEDQLAFRGEGRYVARLLPGDAPKARAPLALRADATYLITGGLGHLGLELARWLVRCGARHLVLTGRAGLPDRAQPDAALSPEARTRLGAVRELEAQGVTVTVAPVDAGDQAAMARVIAALTHPLAGLIHAAGVGTWQPLGSPDSASALESAFRAKVMGTWVLHELTRDLRLDFFVLFSSAASIWAGLGQGHYAAANHFMDAVAHERRASGLPALSVNWGLWADGGTATAESGKLELVGLLPMPTELAIEAMERAMQAGCAQQTVASIGWVTFKSIYESRRRRKLLEEIRTESPPLAEARSSPLRERLREAPAAEGRRLILGLVAGQVAQVLGFEASESIEADRGFFQLGMDSLMAMRLMTGLGAALGQALPTVLAFEHPTVASLSKHLADMLVADRDEAEKAPAPEGEPGEEPDTERTHADSRGHVPIAIIGIGCRFPGGANDPEQFWQNLREGVDAVTEVPSRRWDVDKVYDPDPSAPGKSYSRHGGFLGDVAQFDPLFFGITPRDATCMDPQHRLLLEVAWEALEHAGQPPGGLSGSKTGVFVGITTSDYARMLEASPAASVDAYHLTGSSLNFAAGRLSYVLGLQGAAMAVDTACSSSLVAVHLACQSLRLGDCDLALAGGVNLVLSPHGHIVTSKARLLSASGRCRTFDAEADGMVRSEGCGVVVLKRLCDALAAGDPIVAVICGSAVNQDGPSSGLTVPNKHAQELVIGQALEVAGLDPRQVSYVEAHGTGTPLGDPIEIRALGAALCGGRAADEPLRVGSVKTNIGHTESAAGIAGLIKLALALKHREIPAHLHLRTLNPHLDWSELPIEIPVRRTPWLNARRIGGVSSFGASGTNAHVVLEEAPASAAPAPAAEDPAVLLCLSAKCPESLAALVRAYHGFVTGRPSEAEASLVDVAYTANARRSHHGRRLALVGSSREELAASLDAFLRDEPHDAVVTGKAEPAARPKLTFVFSGQGSQWIGMGRALLAQEPSFRAAIEACDALVTRHAGWSLLKELSAPEESSRLHETEVAQPALLAVQVAISALWRRWGVVPDAVIGHSVGEVAAAHIAGILSLDDAVRLVVARGRIMQRTAGLGKMASVAMSPAAAALVLEGYGDRLAVAAINDPRSVVLSGDAEAISEVVERSRRSQVHCRLLRVNYAFHSPQMAPLERELERAISGIEPRRAALPMFSTVTGARAMDEELDAAYWARSIRAPVQFSGAMEAAIAEGYRLFVEVGPHPVLSGNMQQCLAEQGVEGYVVVTLRRGQAERRSLLRALGALYAHGYHVDWKRLYPSGGRCVALPTYPWHRQRYWLERETPSDDSTSGKPAGEAPEAPLMQQLGGAPAHERRRTMERWLQRAVSKTFGLGDPERVDPAASLLDLGLDSLMSLELRDRIVTSLGIKLSVNWAFDFPTVASLAERALAALDPPPELLAGRARRGGRSSPLIAVQSAGDGLPLFCVHPSAGPVLSYAELARHLGTARPFYGLQEREPDDDQGPDEKVEVVAERYIEAMRSVQPSGPYLVSGWSYGGIVAFEMANQLTKAHEHVGLLAIFDSFFSYGDDDATRLWQRVELAKMIVPERPRDELRRMTERELLDLTIGGVTKARMDGFAESVRRLATAHRHALKDYVPPRYPGRVTYFRAAEQPPGPPFKSAEPYGSFYHPIGELSHEPIELHEVPGSHFTMLREPHVRTLAERLKQCIESRDGRPGDTEHALTVAPSSAARERPHS